jgi:hypothetical protein
VESNNGRSIPPRSFYAFFGQGTADATASAQWIDDEHPDDWPGLVEVTCFGPSRPHVGDGIDNRPVALGDDDLSRVGKQGHSADRRRHCRPIGVLGPELIEGGKS